MVKVALRYKGSNLKKKNSKLLFEIQFKKRS